MNMTTKEKLSTDNGRQLTPDDLHYVTVIARQYSKKLADLDDLVSEGNLGLLKAAQKYDESRGKPFVTFAAPYIREAIEKYIKGQEAQAGGRRALLVSTDESLPVGSNNNFTLLNVLEDKDATPADASLEQQTRSDQMVGAMHVLDERERAVITRYFGVGCQRLTMIEIGMELNLKRERVRQIRDKALRKLKRA